MTIKKPNPYKQFVQFVASEPTEEEIIQYCQNRKVIPHFSGEERDFLEYGDTYERLAQLLVNGACQTCGQILRVRQYSSTNYGYEDIHKTCPKCKFTIIEHRKID